MNKQKIRMAVTGASGFIACGVLERLSTSGFQAMALSRSSAPSWLPSAVNWYSVPSYDDVSALCAGLHGADCVLHLADDPRRDADRDPIAAERIANALIEAMRRTGVKRVIVPSSIYARNHERSASRYGAGKAAIERQFIQAIDLQTVVLRLPPVYGPSGGGGMATLVNSIKRRVPLPFGLASAPRAYLSRRNLAHLILHLAAADDVTWASTSGKVFEPSDGQQVSTRELVAMIAARIGVKAVNLPIPLSLLRALGRMSGRSEMISGAIDPLEVANVLELDAAFNWKPVERMPESLDFLKKQVTSA